MISLENIRRSEGADAVVKFMGSEARVQIRVLALLLKGCVTPYKLFNFSVSQLVYL